MVRTQNDGFGGQWCQSKELRRLVGVSGGAIWSSTRTCLAVRKSPEESKVPKYEVYPRPPNVPLLGALWSLLVGIWGILKGSWGVLDMVSILGIVIMIWGIYSVFGYLDP